MSTSTAALYWTSAPDGARHRPVPGHRPVSRPPDRRLRAPARARGHARLAVLLAAVLLAVGAVPGRLGGGPHPAPEPLSSRPVPLAAVSYVVQPGDTLWAIARALQSDGDLRPLVARLAAGRAGAPLQPGERITLPS